MDASRQDEKSGAIGKGSLGGALERSGGGTGRVPTALTGALVFAEATVRAVGVVFETGGEAGVSTREAAAIGERTAASASGASGVVTPFASALAAAGSGATAAFGDAGSLAVTRAANEGWLASSNAFTEADVVPLVAAPATPPVAARGAGPDAARESGEMAAADCIGAVGPVTTFAGRDRTILSATLAPHGRRQVRVLFYIAISDFSGPGLQPDGGSFLPMQVFKPAGRNGCGRVWPATCAPFCSANPASDVYAMFFNELDQGYSIGARQNHPAMRLPCRVAEAG